MLCLLLVNSSLGYLTLAHCKLCSCWLPNTSESDTNNMKSTWPMREFCVGDPTPPIFYLLTLGLVLGVTQILVFALGVTQILAFLDTDMLVYPTQICGFGGLSQREDPSQMVLRHSGI